MRIDPYFIKRLPKYHPKRLVYTLYARLQERFSRFFFEEYALPCKSLSPPAAPQADWHETQVTQEQAAYLLWGLRETESLFGCVAEVGSWRGVTTALLAENTNRKVVAVDPWIGDRNEVNMKSFLARTARFNHIIPERKPFGQAVREWAHGPVSFIFIDAAHDYVNVAHDLAAARIIVQPDGIIALHDTDNIAFAGCRRAVYEAAEDYNVIAHIENLILLRKRNGNT